MKEPELQCDGNSELTSLTDVSPSDAMSATSTPSTGEEQPSAGERVMLCTLALLSGGGTAVQAGVNVSLATTMVRGEGQNTLLAGLFSFVGGFLLLLIMNAGECVYSSSVICRKPQNWYEVLGGFFGSTVMTCTILSTPQIGFALCSVMRVAGTQFTATTFDHIGFLGMQPTKVTIGKGVGIVLVLFGALLSVSNDVTVSSSLAPVLLLTFSVLAATGGALLPLQASVNRKLCESIGGVRIRATLVSFTGGVICLALQCLLWMSHVQPELAENFTLEDSTWWMYTGGSFGVFGVTMNIVNPARIGMATHFMFVIAGNLMFSTLLDAWGAFGVGTRSPTVLRVCGVAVSFGGALFVEYSKAAVKVPPSQGLAVCMEDNSVGSAAADAIAWTTGESVDNAFSELCKEEPLESTELQTIIR